MAELEKYAGTADLPEVIRTLVSRCLDYIKGPGEEAARPYFHSMHIARSDRLKTGYEATQKMSKYSKLPVK